MQIYQFIEYLALKLKNPDYADYLKMGHGIEERYQRTSKYWEKHLQLSKSFQRIAFESMKAQSVAILGAGRLYDLDRADLISKFERISLYDADPGVLKYWKRFAAQATISKRQVNFQIGDVTAQIIPWSKALAAFLKAQRKCSLSALCSFLNKLPHLPTNQLKLNNADVVISLNLLSQIPLFWRDHLLDKLIKSSLLDDDSRALPVELERTIKRLCQHLQLQHLEWLANCGAKKVILLSDTHIHYYRDDLAPWQTEEALCLPQPLTDLASKIIGPVEKSDSWFWHIAPQHIESPDHGIIHQVQALSLAPNRPQNTDSV